MISIETELEEGDAEGQTTQVGEALGAALMSSASSASGATPLSPASLMVVSAQASTPLPCIESPESGPHRYHDLHEVYAKTKHLVQMWHAWRRGTIHIQRSSTREQMARCNAN